MRLSLTGSPELVYEIASAVDCFYPRGLAEAREFPQIFYEIACGLAAAFGLAVAWELAALKQQLLLVHGAAPAAVDARPGALWRRSAWSDGRGSLRCSRGSSMRRPYQHWPPRTVRRRFVVVFRRLVDASPGLFEPVSQSRPRGASVRPCFRVQAVELVEAPAVATASEGSLSASVSGSGMTAFQTRSEISTINSGLFCKKALAFSRPWPSCSPS